MWPSPDCRGDQGPPSLEPPVHSLCSCFAKISPPHVQGSRPQALHHQACTGLSALFPHFFLSHVFSTSPIGPVCLLPTPCPLLSLHVPRRFLPAPTCTATLTPVPSPGHVLPVLHSLAAVPASKCPLRSSKPGMISALGTSIGACSRSALKTFFLSPVNLFNLLWSVSPTKV